MREINQARRILYRVLESGKNEEIIEESRKLDKLILSKMQQLRSKKQCSFSYQNNCQHIGLSHSK